MDLVRERESGIRRDVIDDDDDDDDDDERL